MLQSIRDRAQGIGAWVIVILIAIPFTMWGAYEYIQPRVNTAVAEVDGVKIERAEFDNAVQQRQHYFRSMFRIQDISFMQEQIERDTLNDLIDQTLLIQVANKQGMRVGDLLLASQIQKNSIFQENNQFSSELYQQLLASRGLNPIVFEAQMRRDLLAQQLADGVINTAFSTSYDQQQQNKLKQQQRLISYATLSKDAQEVIISDEEIEKHYQDNAIRYMTEEQVQVEYVLLTLDDVVAKINFEDSYLEQIYQERLGSYTTPEEWKARHILISADNADKAQQILELLQEEGADFAALAKEHSQDSGSAQRGGDLGWFSSGRMVKPFEDAVANLEVGEITAQAVQSQFGLHIIKLEDKKPASIKPFAEVKTELETNLRQEYAHNRYRDQLIDDLADLAFQFPDSLTEIARNMELNIQTSPLLTRTGIAEHEIFSDTKIIAAAFGDAVLLERRNSEPVEFTQGKTVVMRLKQHIAPQLRPLEEVKDSIQASLTDKKASMAVHDLGENIFKSIANQDISLLTTEHNLVWSDMQWLGREANNIDKKILDTAFKLGNPTDGQAIYHGLSLDNGDYAILAVVDVRDGPEIDAEQLKRLQTNISASEYNSFLAGLRERHEVKLYNLR